MRHDRKTEAADIYTKKVNGKKLKPSKRVRPLKVHGTSSREKKKTFSKRELFLFLADYDPTRSNAETLLRCTTAYPFRVNDKSILCVYCHELYDDPDVFRAHMDQEHAECTLKIVFHNLPKTEFIKADLTNLRCRMCSETFNDLDAAAAHLTSVHGQKIDLNGKLGVMPYKLTRNSFNCAVCDKNVPSLLHLNRHTITHFLSYVCHYCGSSYIATTGLLRHLRTKHQEYEVWCKTCRKMFPNMEAKERHRRTEKSCMPYSCQRCSERFLDWKSRQRHMEVKHGIAKKTYRCGDCNIDFTSDLSYYSHFKLQHSDNCAVCKHCGMKFVSTYRLKRHLAKHNL